MFNVVMISALKTELDIIIILIVILIIEHSGDVHPHPGPYSGLVKTIPVHTSNRLTSTNNNPPNRRRVIGHCNYFN